MVRVTRYNLRPISSSGLLFVPSLQKIMNKIYFDDLLVECKRLKILILTTDCRIFSYFS